MQLYQLLFLLLFFNYGYADCTFRINNYSNKTLNIKVGYFNSNDVTVKLSPNSNKDILLKNKLYCNSITSFGSGVVFANLIGDKSTGGFIFDPSNNMIRAFGSYNLPNGNIGSSPDGTQLLLSNNLKPSIDRFVVQINNANRDTSRQIGSFNN
jgi:hypothetical protein